jgi:predicted RNA binding protein YcfA (HicA-like mRNA interferase family)
MVKLAPIHHRELERFVVFVGCEFVRQEGSHRVYWRDDQIRPIIVPCYKSVPVFIIRNILRQLKISVPEYCRIMDEL